MVIALAGFAAVGLALVAFGVGDSRQPGPSPRPKSGDEAGRARQPGVASDPSEAEGRNSRRQQQDRSAGGSGQPTRKGKTFTSPNGAVITLPPKPTATRVRASAGCVRSVAQAADGRSVPISLPPSPGLTAKRLSAKSALITYTFRRLPAACKPTLIKLLLRDGDSDSPPLGEEVRVRGLVGRQRVTVPGGLFEPDIVGAIAYARDGRSSANREVLIR